MHYDETKKLYETLYASSHFTAAVASHGDRIFAGVLGTTLETEIRTSEAVELAYQTHCCIIWWKFNWKSWFFVSRMFAKVRIWRLCKCLQIHVHWKDLMAAVIESKTSMNLVVFSLRVSPKFCWEYLLVRFSFIGFQAKPWVVRVCTIEDFCKSWNPKNLSKSATNAITVSST